MRNFFRFSVFLLLLLSAGLLSLHAAESESALEAEPVSAAEEEVLPEPKTVQEFYEAGMKAMEEGDYDAGIPYLEKARDMNPEIAQLHNAVGIAYLQQEKDPDAALAAFQEAIRIDPNLADAHNNLGIIYTGMLEDYDLAEEYFNEAIRIEPNFSRAYFGLGWLYLTKQKDPVRAREALQKSIELSPENAESYYYLGLAYILSDQKPQTLTPITILKSKGKVDFAQALELMMEEDSKVMRARFYGEAEENAEDELVSEPADNVESSTSMVQL